MNLKLRLAIGCLLATSATLTAPFAHGANLMDVYQRALQSDPSIREADATRLASKEAKPQAWAALLPQIDGSASKNRTESETGGSEPRVFVDRATGIPTLTTGESEASSTGSSWQLSLRQTVFRWDRFIALKRADIQVAQAEATYRAAEQDLVIRVARRYFDVLAAQDTLDASNAAAEAAARQLEQAEKRFEVGLIAITDVQDARAERDRTAADVIRDKRALATNFELLREITGDAVENLAPPRDDMPLKSPDPAQADRWVSLAMEQNISLIAARLSAEIASKNVESARSGHLPTLDLSVTHSDSNTDSTTDTFLATGVSTSSTTSDSKRDQISLSLNVPIFSGGATSSQTRQAVYQHRATRERVERVTRETERAARDSYLGVTSNIARVQALKQAFESSKTALQATQAGYEVGTRTSVDVLISQRALYSAQTSYLRSRYDYINSVFALKIAAGMLTKDDVVEINSWLK